MNSSQKNSHHESSQVKIYSQSKQSSNVRLTEHKKRGTSPYKSSQANLNNQNILVEKKEKSIRESLAGGSRVNTKTGSMLNFGIGEGSKMNDNMSMVSRYT